MVRYGEKMILQVRELNKSIKKKKILKNISFSIQEKEILGFIGPNGSGKSTTMKCICGLYYPTSGSIKIDGYDVIDEREKALSQIGVSIESPALYPNLTGEEHFRIVSAWRNLDKNRIIEMEKFSGLNEGLKKEVRTYSMGMKQRLILSLSMMAKPKLLILDEPTNGLDPQAIIDLRNKLLDIRNEGTSILLSSHQLDEVDKLVDRIIFIKNGEIIGEKTKEQLHKKHIYNLKTSDNIRAQIILKKYKVFQNEGFLAFECNSNLEFSNVINLLVKEDISIYAIQERVQELEDYYQRLYKG